MVLFEAIMNVCRTCEIGEARVGRVLLIHIM